MSASSLEAGIRTLSPIGFGWEFSCKESDTNLLSAAGSRVQNVGDTAIPIWQHYGSRLLWKHYSAQCTHWATACPRDFEIGTGGLRLFRSFTTEGLPKRYPLPQAATCQQRPISISGTASQPERCRRASNRTSSLAETTIAAPTQENAISKPMTFTPVRIGPRSARFRKKYG